MIEATVAIFKIGIRIGLVTVSVILFSVLFMSVSMNLVMVAQGSIIGDLMGLLQIWLPFNLNSVVVWLLGIATAFIGYRVSIKAVEFIKDIVGTN